MSACRGETAELDLTGTLTLNFLAWIEFLRDILGFVLVIFPNMRDKPTEANTQWHSSISERGGQEEHCTALPLQLHLQGKSRAVFCHAALGTFVIQHPCRPAACLGGLLTNTAYLKHPFLSLRPVLPAPILVWQLSLLSLLGGVLQCWSFWAFSHTWV